MAQNSKHIVEEYLVACARMGDQAAQQQLVSRYQKKFLRHAYRLLGEAEQARDAVQDGWIEILRGLPKLQDDGAFAAWAFRIVTRRCTRAISGFQKNRKVMQTLQGEPRPENSAERDIERAADRKPLNEAMGKLPAEQRAAIALFYLEEMSVAEVAVSMDIPVGTVKSRLMHARQKLRVALEGEDHG